MRLQHVLQSRAFGQEGGQWAGLGCSQRCECHSPEMGQARETLTVTEEFLTCLPGSSALFKLDLYWIKYKKRPGCRDRPASPTTLMSGLKWIFPLPVVSPSHPECTPSQKGRELWEVKWVCSSDADWEEPAVQVSILRVVLWASHCPQMEASGITIARVYSISCI